VVIGYLHTQCPFYRVPEYDGYHGMSCDKVAVLREQHNKQFCVSQRHSVAQWVGRYCCAVLPLADRSKMATAVFDEKMVVVISVCVCVRVNTFCRNCGHNRGSVLYRNWA